MIGIVRVFILELDSHIDKLLFTIVLELASLLIESSTGHSSW